MYTMKDLAMSTRLSDRTLRNYLDSGILQGQKENGRWVFTPEQVDAFLQNDTVKTAICAKNKAILNDFWEDTRKKENSVCVIWDLPESDPMRLMLFVCDAVNQRENVVMSFESHGQKSRILLRGREADIFGILAEYRQSFPDRI